MPITADLVELRCCVCGGRYAMHSDLYAQRQEDKGKFWCPAGHDQHFTGDTTSLKVVKLKQQVAELNRSLSEAYARQQDLRVQAAEARKAAGIEKGKATRLANRAAAALCPAEDCHRSFVQLHRHLVAKHPELARQAAAERG